MRTETGATVGYLDRMESTGLILPKLSLLRFLDHVNVSPGLDSRFIGQTLNNHNFATILLALVYLQLKLFISLDLNQHGLAT
jgi:hypothetical protein